MKKVITFLLLLTTIFFACQKTTEVAKPKVVIKEISMDDNEGFGCPEGQKIKCCHPKHYNSPGAGTCDQYPIYHCPPVCSN